MNIITVLHRNTCIGIVPRDHLTPGCLLDTESGRFCADELVRQFGQDVVRELCDALAEPVPHAPEIVPLALLDDLRALCLTIELDFSRTVQLRMVSLEERERCEYSARGADVCGRLSFSKGRASLALSCWRLRTTGRFEYTVRNGAIAVRNVGAFAELLFRVSGNDLVLHMPTPQLSGGTPPQILFVNNTPERIRCAPAPPSFYERRKTPQASNSLVSVKN